MKSTGLKKSDIIFILKPQIEYFSLTFRLETGEFSAKSLAAISGIIVAAAEVK